MKETIKILKYKAANKFIIILTLFFIASFSAGFSQNQQSKPTRQSALDAFSKGNFKQAYIQFNELSAIYPKDPLYKYYCGVSLVKLQRDPEKALSLLNEAQQGSAVIKTIPNDGLFYLARAEQMNGNFNEAIKSFSLYTNLVGRKIAKEMSTPQFIQQCNEKKGEIAAAKTVNEEIVKRDSIQPVNDGKVKFTSKIGKANPDSTGKKEKSLSPEYEKLINESLNYQFRADSIMELADLSRKQYEKAPDDEKPALKSKISETEQLADTIQKLADAKVLAAENLTKPKSGQALIPGRKDNPDSIFAKKSINNAVNSKVSEAGKDTTFPNLKENIQQSITQKADNQIVKDTANQLVTKEKTINTVPKNKELYSIFEVIAKPTYAADEKTPVNPEVPVGLIYRIQLAVFRNQVNKVYFKGITPVYGFKSNVPDVTIYYAGMFRRSVDASKALVKVKSAGFKDAFVVALLDKKIISAERAGILEKEWGNKPFNSFQTPKTPDTPRDTVPPTLIFRVEVIKSQKPLSNEQLDNIKRLAGNRGLDVIKNDSGQNIYLIGKFLTFESAAEYADLLKRNGQKDAKVTSYLGRREIPVETAKQLFDKF